MTQAAAAQQTTHITKGTILLVEDDRTSMDILSVYLERAGYDIDQAVDGQQAWEKLQGNHHYDLVVTDRLMPNMDGMELFLRIRGDAKLNHIPVIMETGANDPEEIREGIKAGVYYYLTKPYEEETLLTLVRSAIDESTQQEDFRQRLEREQNALGTFNKGEFQISTPEEVENLSFLLAGLFARPDRAVVGLYELLMNAIEHGNLGLGQETKATLIAANEWHSEITRRLALPENQDKKVRVTFEQNDGSVSITITDSGAGFNWRPYLEIEPSRATKGSGRGIAKANMLCFEHIEFKAPGNQVIIKDRAA